MKVSFLIYSLLFFWVNAMAQDSTIVNQITIDNKVSFTATLPALTQIPGAPLPFYSYLWDFGDGHFSTEAAPTHIYKNEGNYNATLYAVNNYDDGKKPGSKTKPVQVNRVNSGFAYIPSNAEKSFFKANGIFESKYNCMAKPGDSMVIISGWNNMASAGKLFLLINEKSFGAKCFDTSGINLYNQATFNNDKNAFASLANLQEINITSSGSPASKIVQYKKLDEQGSKAIVQTLQSKYDNVFAFDIPKSEVRSGYIFTKLLVTAEMLKDTSATIVISGLFVPDEGISQLHQLNIPIVTSHDPNKMSLQQGPLSYRALNKKKSLPYKIRFQNNGEGPARKIALQITLPSALDAKTLKVTEVSPACPPCDSIKKTGCYEVLGVNDSDSLTIQFNGIYLSGSQQQGVTDYDSTKGFVTFEVKSKKKLDNKPFKGKTAIIFDKNPPVITNFATGRFKKSLSPIFMAGYEGLFNAFTNKSGLQFGVGLSPLASRKIYWQVELVAKTGYDNNRKISSGIDGLVRRDSNSAPVPYKSFVRNEYSTGTRIALPLQARYNVSRTFGVGVGVHLETNFIGDRNIDTDYNLRNGLGIFKTSTQQKQAAFNKISYTPFIDLQVGRVKYGPQLGSRCYLRNNQQSSLYAYASWRL